MFEQCYTLVSHVTSHLNHRSSQTSNLKPGGYIECQDVVYPVVCMDTTLTPETSAILRWCSLFIEAEALSGLDATAANHFGSKLHAAGFVDIRRKSFKWPLGKWVKGEKYKQLGYWVEENFLDFLPSSVFGLFTRVLKWSRDEVELFLSECRREMREHKERHFYAHM